MSPTSPFPFSKLSLPLALALIGTHALAVRAAETPSAETWTQWRGPSRDGQVAGPSWPA